MAFAEARNQQPGPRLCDGGERKIADGKRHPGALLLPEQSAKEAAIVRDRLLAQVPDCRAAVGTEYPWNLTVGIAAYPEDGESFETLLAAADRRLYAQRGTYLRAGNEQHAGTAVPAPALATS